MICRYEEKYREKWDNFVMRDSVNGTFLQTRRFLSYHSAGRFCDHSLLVMTGSNIMAVIPAHEVAGPSMQFVSHAGSTFGGIIVGKYCYNIRNLDDIFAQLLEYWKTQGFGEAVLRQTSGLYAQKPTELLDYYYYYHGFSETVELAYYIDLANEADTALLEASFSRSRRHCLQRSRKYCMEFRELASDDEISRFYDILCRDREKFHVKPVHTLEELLEFKNVRLQNETAFYGLFFNGEMIAGGMIFLFGDKQVFHAQYFACDPQKMEFRPSERLYYSMIQEAAQKGFRAISFGTSTTERGKVLNRGLAQFKEGFGSTAYVNRTYYKRLDTESQ